jgi:hypothetical protein
MPSERRDHSGTGRKRRRDFQRSLEKLRDLGMPNWAVTYYRRAARIASLQPHEIVCHIAVVTAMRQLQGSLKQAISTPIIRSYKTKTSIHSDHRSLPRA